MSARVFVGMSGGVDSSVAAALLVEAGFDVTGVFMRNWAADLPGHDCPWAADLADAEEVAVRLGIDLVVWDFEEDYEREVVAYLVDAYERGLTPNPDVMCNERIKFGIFAERAFAEGADFIATGHYARTETDPQTGAARLLRAADAHKDQTYFLWRVGAGVLSHTLFPIGEVPTKDEVRRMASERGLVVADKPDSTGICFVGEVGIRQFLLSRIPPRPGPIVDVDTGETIGTHEGAFLFTLGQRRGLDVGGGPARFVVSTDTDANIVWVSSSRAHDALRTHGLSLADCRWVAGEPPRAGEYDVRMRHTGRLTRAVLEPLGAVGARLVFDGEVEMIAAGQSVVAYDGEVCLGGGTVAGR